MPSTTPIFGTQNQNPFAIQPPQGAPANSSAAPLANYSGISQFIGQPLATSGSTSLPAQFSLPAQNYAQQTGLSPTPTTTNTNFSVPSNLPVSPYSNSPLFNPANFAGNGNRGTAQPAPAPSPVAPPVPPGFKPGSTPAGAAYGIGGVWYDASGNPLQQNVQPSNPAPAPEVTGSLNTTSNVSNFASNPSNNSDLFNAINANLENYQKVSQISDQELQSQQQLLAAIGQMQNAQVNSQAFNLATQGKQLSWFGRGVPLDLAMSEYNNVGFGAQVQQGLNQLSITQAQNAANIAQQGLSLEQQNRQIRSQAAYQALQGTLSEAGLAQQGRLAQLPYQNLTADQKLALDLQYFQATGQMPNFGGGPSSGFSSLVNNGSTTSTMAPNNILGYDLSTYATDPQYENKIMSSIGTMPQQMTTSSQIQSWIADKYPNSPITGDMIMNASTSAGVSPKALSAVLAVESQMGSDGSAGARMNNPGNYGNSDSAMAQGRPTGFGSMQDGINHVAQWLAQHHASQQSQIQAPAQIQPAVETLSDGTPYLNQEKIPSNFQAMAQLYASRSGIPILTADEVTKARSIDITTQNLNQISQTIPQILSSGFGGRLQGLIGNQLQDFLQTNPTIASFNTYRDTAINAIQALAGGSGSGFRLNQSEIDTATSNLPQITDNLETAQNKLAVVQSFVNKWKNELLPNQNVPTSPAQLNPGNQSQPQQVVYQGQTYNVDAQGNMTPA
jgi:hypothetical protein